MGGLRDLKVDSGRNSRVNSERDSEVDLEKDSVGFAVRDSWVDLGI